MASGPHKVGNRWHIRWYSSDRDPKEVRDTFSADAWSKTEIASYMKELEVAYEKGEYDPWTMDSPQDSGPTPTIDELMDQYIDHKTAAGRRGEAHGWSESTRQGKESVLRDWVREVGPHRRINDLTHGDVRSYVYQEGLSTATRKGYRTHLNAWLSWVEGQGHDIPKKVPPLGEDTPDPEWITEEELYKICGAWCAILKEKAQTKHVPRQRAYKQSDLTEIWRLSFYQGLRLGEIVRLRVSDVDTSDWLMRIGTEQKSGRSSTIPVTPPARDVLRPFLTQRHGGGQVFERNAKRRISKCFKRAMRRVIGDEARAERLRFHSLRHSCAVFWRRKGMALADIRDLLRHQSIRTTEIYDKMVPSDLSKRFESAADQG